MDDLVQQLRRWAKEWDGTTDADLCERAAIRIEGLEREADIWQNRAEAAEAVVEAVKQYKAEPNLKTSEGVERALHEWRKEYERKS